MSERIVRLAGRGDGVTDSGRFFPMTAPGDIIKEDGAVEPGPHRIVPPCRHYPTCGGCQLQHVDDSAYGHFLVDRIASALAAQGLGLPDILAPHISPPRTRRRTTLHAERRGGRVLIGFNAQASHDIVDMHECHVLSPALFALVAPLRTLLARMLPPRRRAQLVMTLCDQGCDLLVDGAAPEGLEAIEATSAFARTQRLARLSVDDGTGPQTLWEPDPVTITLGRTAVRLPTNSFLQATREGEAVLVETVRAAIGKAGIVADLFAGLGTFALSLDARVLAAEGARDAALALKSAADLAERPIFVDHRDLYRRPFTPEELGRFEAIVLDPPRAGAREQVASLAKSDVPTIAYVSCNPATFSRDAATLIAGGYAIRWIKPVGQFRWSTHVELAASFTRGG